MHNVDNNASDNEMLSYLKQDFVYKSPWTEGRNVCWPCSYIELSAIPNYPCKRRLFTCSFPRHDRQTNTKPLLYIVEDGHGQHKCHWEISLE